MVKKKRGKRRISPACPWAILRGRRGFHKLFLHESSAVSLPKYRFAPSARSKTKNPEEEMYSGKALRWKSLAMMLHEWICRKFTILRCEFLKLDKKLVALPLPKIVARCAWHVTRHNFQRNGHAENRRCKLFRVTSLYVSEVCCKVFIVNVRHLERTSLIWAIVHAILDEPTIVRNVWSWSDSEESTDN